MTAPELAARLDAARRAGRTLAAPLGVPDLDAAYAVQRELTALRLARGDGVVGWKLGYTSVAMREQMGVAGPNFGPLLASMRLEDGEAVPASALQPRVEPEIALVLARPVPPGAGVNDVLACCAGAHAALEVVDSVWTGYRFSLLDNTADGSSAGWFVLGPRLPLDGLDRVEVVLSAGDSPVASATGAAAGGHPARGVAWLAGQLSGASRGLAAGDVVITGGLTAAVPLEPGVPVRATFGAAVAVMVRLGAA